MSQNISNECNIRTYIRLFPSMGIDQILDNQYQILDGNTFFTKKQAQQSLSSGAVVPLLQKKIPSSQPSMIDTSKYTMYSFNYIFNNQFQNLKQIQHMNVIDDCFEGKNQIIFMAITKEFVQQFLIGSPDQPGFFITLFTELYNQLYYSSSLPRKSTHSLSLSSFSTASNSNNFMDLILCQKYTFYSKKDIDEHKDFYAKQIKQLREFLILLKIILLHYQECCKDSDPIVFRIVVDGCDQVTAKKYQSVILLVLAETGSKVQSDFVRKVSFSIRCGGLAKGEDHGSLVNYLERYINKSKFVYIYGIPFRKSVMESSTQMFDFLSELRNHRFQLEQSADQLSLAQKAQKLNSFVLPKCCLGSRNLSHKQINQAVGLVGKLSDFLSESQTKWKIYSQVFESIISTQDQFYERLRFPISLQIQQYSIKSFMISKVYRLSQTYKMQDLIPSMQKIRTIKNQVLISFKALCSSKEVANFRTNPHSEEFFKYFDQCLALTMKNLKVLFGVSYRSVQVAALSLSQIFKIETIFDIGVLKSLSGKLMNQAKKIKEKEEILLRSLNMSTQDNLQNQNISVRQPIHKEEVKNFFSGTKTFQLFKLNRSIKKKSDLVQNSQRISPIKSHFLENTIPIHEQRYSELVQIQNNLSRVGLSSPCEKSLNKKVHHSHSYSISLPKIAIIHRKKNKR